jgi:hypothetical protein
VRKEASRATTEYQSLPLRSIDSIASACRYIDTKTTNCWSAASSRYGLHDCGAREAPTLGGLFGASSLLRAVLGLYGVMTHVATQRSPEIGIRPAIGAETCLPTWGERSAGIPPTLNSAQSRYRVSRKSYPALEKSSFAMVMAVIAVGQPE